MTARRPEYVITEWVSPQLRERMPGLPLSVAEVTSDLERTAEVAPEAEAEAEAEIEL